MVLCSVSKAAYHPAESPHFCLFFKSIVSLLVNLNAVWVAEVIKAGTLNTALVAVLETIVPFNPLTVMVDPYPMLLPVIVRTPPLNDVCVVATV